MDIAESMAELKVSLIGELECSVLVSENFPQNKLEAQYAAKRDAHASEVQDLKQQLEIKGNEIRTLNGTIDSLKSVNEELKVGTERELLSGRCHAEAFDPPSSVHSLSRRLASRVARTSRRARRTLSGLAKRLACSSPNLTVSRSRLCAICRTVARRYTLFRYSFRRAACSHVKFCRSSSLRSSLTKSRSSTTMSSATATARLSRRRWRSWSATSSSSR